MAKKRQLVFLATLIASVWVSACGRQVTPNPPGLGAGGAPVGFMSVVFDVQAPFNFSQYQYMIVFNTSGSGVTPSTDSVRTNWAGYSVALIALGSALGAYAKYMQFVPSLNPHQPPGWVFPITPPQQFSFDLNNNGTGTEFSLLVQKSILRAFATPGPTPGPTPTPTPPSVWTFNAFTTQASSNGTWQFFDSLGAGGPVDPQFISPRLCMTEPFDNTYTAIANGNQIPDPAAQIVTIEIANNPPSPSPCP
ncbi:MAG: hypothetical protein WCB99_05390 [Candidatus Cybelea sp.]